MDQSTSALIKKLSDICREISGGRRGLADELFELTKDRDYPPVISDLAESFGMMLVQMEAREFGLERAVEELERARDRLAQAGAALAQENKSLRLGLREKFSPGRILGKSRAMREVLAKVERISDTPVSVLVTGETGTGKELVAKALHYNSSRAAHPFVAINCTAIPEALFEAEIFGIEKGVATGVERRAGKVEQADHGTLFLDEIGDMPAASQAKILRVLEERQVRRVGGSSERSVDIRVIAATHKDLRAEIAAGRFREDLFYRLNVVELRLPPLRERHDDIEPLLNSFLDIYCAKFGRQAKRFTPESLELLRHYPWPGNVRELENEVERAVALAWGQNITLEDLSEEVLALRAPQGEALPPAEEGSLEQVERRHIEAVLARTGGNKTEAAKILGLSREGLRKKLKTMGI